MIVSREDIINVLDTIRAVPYSNGLHIVFRNDTIFPQNDEKHFNTIRQVLEDRLNQSDYKALAEEQNKFIIELTWDEGDRAKLREMEEIISKYEAIKGE